MTHHHDPLKVSITCATVEGLPIPVVPSLRVCCSNCDTELWVSNNVIEQAQQAVEKDEGCGCAEIYAYCMPCTVKVGLVNPANN